MLSEVKAELEEFRRILYSNCNLMQILVPYSTDDPSQLFGTHTQAQFHQMKSWFELLLSFSYSLLSKVRNSIEAFVDFQRDRPLPAPSLTDLERVCAEFYQSLVDFCGQLKFVGENNLTRILFALTGCPETQLNQWWNEVLKIVEILIQCSLIYEDQPPSIIRKDRIFGAKLRWLVGSKLNGEMVRGLRGTVHILNENMVSSLLRGEQLQPNDLLPITQRTEPNFEVGENGEVAIELEKNILSVISRNPIRYADNRKIDEKYALMFRTTAAFNVWNYENVVEVSAVSLPICLTTHMLQDEYSYGRIMWDYAFSRRPGEDPRVPDVVTWQDLAPVLSRTWRSAIGCDLNDYHLKYLYDKLFNKHPDSQEIPSLTISWTQFARNHMLGMEFSFWSWFYSAMRLIKTFFLDHWKENHVIGFIHKSKAKALLQTNPAPGTFLFRFSESLCGYMSIDVILKEKDYSFKVSSCGPFKDFNNKTLNQFITDFENLAALYPGIPVNQAFPKEPAKRPTVPKGYKSVNTKHTLAE